MTVSIIRGRVISSFNVLSVCTTRYARRSPDRLLPVQPAVLMYIVHSRRLGTLHKVGTYVPR